MTETALKLTILNFSRRCRTRPASPLLHFRCLLRSQGKNEAEQGISNYLGFPAEPRAHSRFCRMRPRSSTDGLCCGHGVASGQQSHLMLAQGKNAAQKEINTYLGYAPEPGTMRQVLENEAGAVRLKRAAAKQATGLLAACRADKETLMAEVERLRGQPGS